MGTKERPGSRGEWTVHWVLTRQSFSRRRMRLAGVMNTAEGKVVNFANFFKKDVDNGCHTGKRM